MNKNAFDVEYSSTNEVTITTANKTVEIYYVIESVRDFRRAMQGAKTGEYEEGKGKIMGGTSLHTSVIGVWDSPDSHSCDICNSEAIVEIYGKDATLTLCHSHSRNAAEEIEDVAAEHTDDLLADAL